MCARDSSGITGVNTGTSQSYYMEKNAGAQASISQEVMMSHASKVKIGRAFCPVKSKAIIEK